MKRLLIFAFFIPLMSLSQEKQVSKPGYPNYVGDIEFNPETDKQDFELSSVKQIFQYFNNGGGLEYEGEKLAIEREFAGKYKSEIIEDQTGVIRINFVVNYKCETDRFRLISMDGKYNEKLFAQSITTQLMSITKSLKGWKAKKINGNSIDYYQYLIFRIENGQLKEILP